MMARLRTIGLVLLALGCLALAARWGAHGPDRAEAGTAVGGDAPPGVRFVTVALGGFRGLLADVLWVRAADLQEQGAFFEVAQLANWITRLEPRYPEVWSYHAWNMAYNITAVVPDPGDRWHWVMNGVHLLRDQGIPSNPRDPKLYWELGWLFYDKVGGRWDEATLFYRVNWARAISGLFGSGMLNHEALAQHPAVIKAFRDAGLDVEQLKAVDDAFGPFDWRLPESHALYWGYRGRVHETGASRWCDRLLWMSMTETVRQGRLAFVPDRKIYLQGARLDLAAKGISHCTHDRIFDDPLTGMAAARFLREAALYLDAFGHRKEAEAAFATLKQAPGIAEKAVTLDELVRNEAAQMDMLSAESRVARIVGLLARGEDWKRLKVAEYGDGYERLARLYWEALVKEDRQTPAWEILLKQGHEQSLQDVP